MKSLAVATLLPVVAAALVAQGTTVSEAKSAPQDRKILAAARQAMAEWAEAQGRNPFYEISVPDAALKLEQACGRLIRHENDYGRITLLDRRIVTQRYGRFLLESLPPYKLNISPA